MNSPLGNVAQTKSAQVFRTGDIRASQRVPTVPYNPNTFEKMQQKYGAFLKGKTIITSKYKDVDPIASYLAKITDPTYVPRIGMGNKSSPRVVLSRAKDKRHNRPTTIQGFQR